MASISVVREGSARPAGKEASLSVIAAGTKITGELTSDGVVKVEGMVVGTVRAERQVLVAKGGVIKGDVFTRDAIIGGEIQGAILADDRVEVQSTSIIQGDITTIRIIIHEGGEVNGHVRMGNPEALEQHKAEVAERLAEGRNRRATDSVSTTRPNNQ
jgi:cytoskeletal protein CcmA (bactofilin family)